MTAAAEPGYQTRAVARALAILDEFAAGDGEQSIASLHRSLGLPKSTILRLASVLEQHGYLARHGERYEVGRRTFELGALYLRRHRVLDVVRPSLESLRDELLDTICLAALSGPEIVHLLVVPSTRPVHHVTEVGSRAPAHSSGLGKALLALLGDDEVDAALGPAPYERFTPRTLVARSALLAELRRTRRRGYAVDAEESAPGLRCVAVAFDAPLLGPVALSASGSAAGYTAATIPRFAAALARGAEAVEAALGHAAGFSLAT